MMGYEFESVGDFLRCAGEYLLIVALFSVAFVMSIGIVVGGVWLGFKMFGAM